MKLGFTLHQITVGKERRQLPIGSVQSFEDDEYERLEKLTAVRTPTDAELSIYETINGGPAKADAPARVEKAEKPRRGRKSFAEPVADESDADSTSTDPDEIEEI